MNEPGSPFQMQHDMMRRLNVIGNIGLYLSIVGTILYPIFFYSFFKFMNTPLANHGWPVLIVLIVLMGLPPAGLILWQCARRIKSDMASSIALPRMPFIKILFLGGIGGMFSGIIGSGLFALVFCIIIAQMQTAKSFYPMFLESYAFLVIPGIALGIPVGLVAAIIIALYLKSDHC